jgi:hypothetical protein
MLGRRVANLLHQFLGVGLGADIGYRIFTQRVFDAIDFAPNLSLRVLAGQGKREHDDGRDL